MTLGLTLVLAGGSLYLPAFGANSNASAMTPGVAQDEPIASPDTFDWRVYPIGHFDVYYYPALEADLRPIADAAERAYQRISAELTYELADRVPLILFKTRDDFAQQGIVPEIPEAALRSGVSSFAEHNRNRVVILVDDMRDEWLQRITHEVTHIFAFDIIPRHPFRATVPVWVDEGLADYVTGVWREVDVAQLRDTVASDGVPKMSTLEGRGDASRLPYILGHAVFDFIEAEYGKAHVRQFLLELRRHAVDRTDDLYQAAFHLTPDEFNGAFGRYLRRRFSSDGQAAAPVTVEDDLSRLVRRSGGTARPVSFRFRDAELTDVLSFLERVADIRIQMAPGVGETPPINLSFDDASYEDVLRFLLRAANLAYEVVDDRTLLLDAQ